MQRPEGLAWTWRCTWSSPKRFTAARERATASEHLFFSPVVSAKPKGPGRQSRISSFVEVAADGLSSETKKTGKRIGSSEVLWNESLLL